MEEQSKDFSVVATTWDEKPRRVQLAAAVADAIKTHIPLTRQMIALDFGCGTGLVSFNLVDQLGQVVAVDNADGMLKVLRQKAQHMGIENIETLPTTGGLPELDGRSFDLIYSSMVLHHVCEVEPLIKSMVAALAPGGYLALADLDSDDGQFHDQPVGVEHYGFDRSALCRQLQKAGLVEVGAHTAHTIVKQREGKERGFPVFLVSGRKPG
ncbi:MAG: class I SAM-dependent methyltransferase [Desulfuromonas sp.]|nr:class I SAM-dependent methyltransferase [Desulfuromonas sp.]